MGSTIFKEIIEFIRDIYRTDEFIPLHEPRFWGNEKKYLNDCIDSTFVSSVGEYVDRFEEDIARFTGAKHAVAVVNGTQALFIALKLVGAKPGTEVITQSLTFVATANAIHYTGAEPVFLDVEKDTLGLSPKALAEFLENKTEIRDGKCWNRETNRPIAACVPMHTLGHVCRTEEIKLICETNRIELVEDAAEALGSYRKGLHAGRSGKLGVFSFNGNKIITTGGGGMIISDDTSIAKKAKHLTTTAKVDHPWEFDHNEVGYNFRMPNINAALGVAQLEKLLEFVDRKRDLAKLYQKGLKGRNYRVFQETQETKSNYWLNAIVLDEPESKEALLKYANENGVMVRGIWNPIHTLPMYRHCQNDGLFNTINYFNKTINIPSSVLTIE